MAFFAILMNTGRRVCAACGKVIAGSVRPTAGMGLLLGTFLVAPAFAQPVPASPTKVWSEDFSNTSSTPLSLANYPGVGGQNYFANADWLPGYGACNGWVLNNGSAIPTPNDGCNGTSGIVRANGNVQGTASAWNFLKAMASALGNAQIGDPNATNYTAAANNIVASMTNGGSNQVAHIQFQTKDDIPLAAGHYYIISAYFAAVHCRKDNTSWTDASETFNLIQGSGAAATVYQTIGSSLDPCTAKQIFNPYYLDNTYGRIYVTKLQSQALLQTSNVSVGIQILNMTQGSTGNDIAFDLPQILDVTPQLYKSFNPSPYSGNDYTIHAGDTTALTFTIMNTSDLLAKNGWSFTDELPTNTSNSDKVTVAGAATTTCDLTGGGLTAAIGSSTVTVKGNLQAGQSSCTITVPVTAASDGAYPNKPNNFTALTGLLEPADATLYVGDLALSKTAKVTDSKGNPLPGVIEAGDIIEYTFAISNNSSLPVDTLLIRENPGLSGEGSLTPIDCHGTITLAPGDTMICTATHIVAAADFPAVGITNTAYVTGDESGTPVESPPSTVTTPVYMPKLTLVKSVDTDQLVEGDLVTFSFLVTNTGNVGLIDVEIAEVSFSGSGALSAIDCGGGSPVVASLAVKANVTCTATYTVTAADVAARAITNTATASGVVAGVTPLAARSGGGGLVTTPQSTARILAPRSGDAPVPALDGRALALLILLLGALAWQTRRRARQ
ncbi:MAG: DUF11 domain-containing protein [Proteobacteria bacterium]|nr:DUF11 domain-containing protein [Pseudomonadota bacterium]